MTDEDRNILAHYDRIMAAKPGDLMKVISPMCVLDEENRQYVWFYAGDTLRVSARPGRKYEGVRDGLAVRVSIPQRDFKCIVPAGRWAILRRLGRAIKAEKEILG